MGVFGFINTMLLTRVLDQQTYVMYGLLHNFVTPAVMFLCLGFDTAYSRFYYNHDNTQKRFLCRVLLIPAILFLLMAFALLEPSQWIIRQIFGTKFSLLAVTLLLLYTLFSLGHRFTQLTARMEERAFNYVASNFIGRFGFVLIVFGVFAMWKNVDFNWILISSLIGAVFATFLNLWILFKMSVKRNAVGVHVSNREMLKYGFPHMLNSVLIAAIPLLEKMVIRSAADAEHKIGLLGVYTAAAVFQTVVSMVTLTVNNIWNPLVFKHCDDEKTFKPIMHNFGMVITVIIVSGFSVCILLRRWLVLILDGKYHDAYIIAPAICFGACYGLISVIYSSGINIVKKTIHHVVEPVIQIILSAICCFWLVPSMGLVGIGIALLVSIGISRTYKIIVGLWLYDSGSSEHQMWILMAICAIVAFSSLFLTSLLWDVIMFIVLIVAMLLILNKDLKSIVQTAIPLFISRKKTKTE